MNAIQPTLLKPTRNPGFFANRSGVTARKQPGFRCTKRTNHPFQPVQNRQNRAASLAGFGKCGLYCPHKLTPKAPLLPLPIRRKGQRLAAMTAVRDFSALGVFGKNALEGTDIMTPKKLREIYGAPSPHAAAKVISKFDKHCRQFIEHSTFLVLATSNGTNLDVSPKGDPAGFVTVESDKTLLIPDRPGNNRIDGLMNILSHPKVAVIFMIPKVSETLRVNGTAEISDDPSLLDQFQVNGRSPKTVLRITVDEIFTHCGKAPMRAGLWHPETWPTDRPVPSIYEMVRDHSELDVESIEHSYVEMRYLKTLY